MLSDVIAAAFRFERQHLLLVGVIAVVAFLLSAGRRQPRHCPRCHEPNRDHANYCAQCGARLPGK